ncbi:uncharacterized protein LOC127003983 [Eriocheir sinensis]|uniref:uncharacterized protein LOC127003983 n=1 Tax=Eriocheir sinensis TaxID=95602 RepID=UPI0021C8E66C|nr:uncharacterized protein LOC127003983 [Eriocheir sinensis]
MRDTSLGLLGVAATALLFSLLTVQGSSAEEGQAPDASSSIPEAILNLSSNENPMTKEDKERFIFGPRSITTYTAVSVTTSTAFLTCLSGTNDNVCQGRRKKRSVRLMQDISKREGESTSLSTSLIEEADTVVAPTGSTKKAEGDSQGDEKLIFTVWTTARITTSITLVSTDTNTTIRVSFYCLAGNVQLPTINC